MIATVMIQNPTSARQMPPSILVPLMYVLRMGWRCIITVTRVSMKVKELIVSAHLSEAVRALPSFTWFTILTVDPNVIVENSRNATHCTNRGDPDLLAICCATSVMLLLMVSISVLYATY
mmetsp:Transcript_54087/g.65299  ORF Transcript_54087/g.65299 Transcript_54087/m.65299 type:complete len:120 (-) Transcript_54087:215-574(-)